MEQTQVVEGVKPRPGRYPEHQHGGGHPQGAGKAQPHQTGLVLRWARQAQGQCRFTQHVKRWRYGMKTKCFGELLQIDPMSSGFRQGIQARSSKPLAPSPGSSSCGPLVGPSAVMPNLYQAHLIEQRPFKLNSIPVDVGSELWDEFERACQDLAPPVRFTAEVAQTDWLRGARQWHKPVCVLSLLPRRIDR